MEARPNPTRLTEPAEDLSGTNAAYCEEEWCKATNRHVKDCKECIYGSGCDTI